MLSCCVAGWLQPSFGLLAVAELRLDLRAEKDSCTEEPVNAPRVALPLGGEVPHAHLSLAFSF